MRKQIVSLVLSPAHLFNVDVVQLGGAGNEAGNKEDGTSRAMRSITRFYNLHHND